MAETEASRRNTPLELGNLELSRMTTVERISDGICELILRGEVEPGTPLRESQLQASIGVSRNTIREALRVLERDGLVTYHAYRGVTVTQLTPEDVVDLFRARITIELSAVDSAAQMNAEDKVALRQAFEAREQAVAVSDWHAAFEADMRLHSTIVSAIGSPTLDEFHRGLLQKLRLGFYIGGGLDTEGRARDSEQHRRIVELVESGDFEVCREALSEHLEDARRILLDLIERSTASTGPSP